MTFWQIAADEILLPWTVYGHLSRQVVGGEIASPLYGMMILAKD